MIKGKKHDWCGKVNWEGKDECPCLRYMPEETKAHLRLSHPARLTFSDVVFDNPTIEDLAVKARRVLDAVGMKDVTLDFDAGQDNEQGDVVGALIIDGWLTIYPEKEEVETLNGYKVALPAFAVDTSHTVSNYPHEPDDVDVNRMGKYSTPYIAIGECANAIFTRNINNVIEYLYEEDAAKLEPEPDIPF